MTTRNIMPVGNELDQMVKIANVLGEAPFYKKLGPAGIVAILLTAKEMGIAPMIALNGGLYTFDGKVTLSAQIMNAMVISAGHRIDIIEMTDKKCHLRLWRKDRANTARPSQDSIYTIEMAEKAKLLGKDNWKYYPQDMLFSKALGSGVRKYMPDVIANTYVHGELDDAPYDPENDTIEHDSSLDIPKEQDQQYDIEEQEKQSNFCNRHFLEHGSSFDEYINEIVKRCPNSSHGQIVARACNNEKVFLEAFYKWKNSLPKEESEPKEAEEHYIQESYHE